MTGSSTIHPAARPAHGLDELARQILDRPLYAVLGTRNSDGTPHLAPVMFLFDGAEILIETGAATRKARNVAADGRVSVLVDTPDPSWVLVAGSATIVRGRAAADARDRIRSKYLTAGGQAACGDLLDELDDVVIAVAPTSVLCWDMTVFMATLASRGADVDRADTWFVADL